MQAQLSCRKALVGMSHESDSNDALMSVNFTLKTIGLTNTNFMVTGIDMLPV